MGLNLWGTFAYYLSSPVSIFILLFERTNLPEAFIFMTLFKIGLSGFMMNIYLKKTYMQGNLTTIIFSTMYSLMSFSVSYLFNIMWLDSIYLLLLVLLGVEQLFNRKYMLFISSLVILFISNFYMGYIVGVFTFLYFIIKCLLRNSKRIKTLIKDLLTFFICTFFAIGISSFITIPTFIQLKANPSYPFDWSSLLNINVSFVELMAKFYNSGINLLDEPNIYCGLLALLLFPLFFISKKIQVKEKMLFFLLLLFLALSFQINGFNVMWHAFENPTGYLHRFAFVFSFTLILLALGFIMFLIKN